MLEISYMVNFRKNCVVRNLVISVLFVVFSISGQKQRDELRSIAPLRGMSAHGLKVLYVNQVKYFMRNSTSFFPLN